MTEAPAGSAARLPGARVWDALVRIAHWTMAILVAAAWWTGEHDQLDAHRLIGAALAGLLVFRLVWGVVGTRTARFAAFVKGPAQVLRYARTLLRPPEAAGPPGHNPMGGWSVLGLLGLLAVDIVLGLFAVDVDGEASGPLAGQISFEAGRAAAKLHHQAFNLLACLIALHLAAVGFYLLVRRDDLLTPMVTGRRKAPGTDAAEVALWRKALAVGAGLLVALLIAASLGKGS
jgi:cytochrome b